MLKHPKKLNLMPTYQATPKWLNAGLIYNNFEDDSLVSIKMTMQKFFIYEEIDMKNEEQF